jgi:uroporphyrinogen-III decarboxylase
MQSINFFNWMKKPILKQIIKRFMNWNWIWNREFFNIYNKIIEVSVDLNFDAVWFMYLLFKFKKNKEFSLGYAWYDVFGRIWEPQVDQYGNPEPYYVRGHCNTEEKWDNWIEKQSSLFDKSIKYAADIHQKTVEHHQDKIYVISFAAPGIFENSWQPIGFVEFIKFMYEKPKFIEKVVEFQTDYHLKLLEAICKTGNEIVLFGDDLGHKTGPLINPKLLDRFFASSYQRVAEFVHKQNKKLLFHSCGQIYKLLDRFIEWGFDGLLTLEPTAGMDLEKVRKRVGHQLVLVGNIDVSYLLVRGTKKEIESAVKNAIKVAAPGGGFILSPAHNHVEVDPTRLKWMVETAHEFGKYPIQL